MPHEVFLVRRDVSVRRPSQLTGSRCSNANQQSRDCGNTAVNCHYQKDYQRQLLEVQSNLTAQFYYALARANRDNAVHGTAHDTQSFQRIGLPVMQRIVETVMHYDTNKLCRHLLIPHCVIGPFFSRLDLPTPTLSSTSSCATYCMMNSTVPSLSDTIVLRCTGPSENRATP